MHDTHNMACQLNDPARQHFSNNYCTCDDVMEKTAKDDDYVIYGNITHSGAWKCAECGEEVPHSPNWNIMAEGIEQHRLTAHTKSAVLHESVARADQEVPPEDLDIDDSGRVVIRATPKAQPEPERGTARAVIVKAIVDTLRNKKQEKRPAPSITELEKMLNDPEPRDIDILPDGSIAVDMPIYASDLADAVIEALKLAPSPLSVREQIAWISVEKQPNRIMDYLCLLRHKKIRNMTAYKVVTWLGHSAIDGIEGWSFDDKEFEIAMWMPILDPPSRFTSIIKIAHNDEAPAPAIAGEKEG